MPNIIGVGQLTLTDLNDAIISGTQPTNPSIGQLWIDESVSPKMLKKWNGTSWSEMGELDPNISETISDIHETLGNMANDNIIDFNERQVVKDKLTEILGYVITDSATTLPTTATLDAGTSGKGSFFFVRKNATMSGLLSTDSRYVLVATEYNNLKSYLESLTPIDAWDLRTANQSTNITVVKATFRDKWLKYYTAEKDLANATADQLKKNVDNVKVGGTNYASNGDFSINLDKMLWASKLQYGDVTEILDISTETPPHQLALHIKNDVAKTAGYFDAELWKGEVANSLVGKDVTVSFWIKFKNIALGVQPWQYGRFGEVVVEGETSTGTKVYTNLTTMNITGTDTVWKKKEVTYRIVLPDTAVKLTKISFKHCLEGCVGEFWTTGIKVELGNKATDWSQSPYDIQQRFVNAEFQLTSDQITSKVTSNQAFIAQIQKVQGNMIDNPSVTSGLGRWSGNGLSIIDSDFFGKTTKVLQSSILANTQNYHDYIDVDPAKSYEVTFWIKKSTNLGRVYVGCLGYDGRAGNAVGLTTVNMNGVVSLSDDTNPYLYYSNLNTSPTDWMKVTAYIMPTGTTPLSMKDIGSPARAGTGDTRTNIIMNANVRSIRFRFLNWDNTTENQVWVANPIVREVDPNTVETLSTVGTRLTTAESKITDSAIVNTVTSSTQWQAKLNKDEVGNLSTSQLIRNSSWETDTNGWVLSDVVTRNTSLMLEGRTSMKFVSQDKTSDIWKGLLLDKSIPVKAGETYTASIYTHSTNIDGIDNGLALQVNCYNDTDTVQAYKPNISIKPTTNNTWQRFNVVFTIPSGTTKIKLFAFIVRNGVAFVSSPMVQKGNVLSAWTPHIEEMATELKSQISQQAGRIDIVVSSNNTIKAQEIASAISVTPTAIDLISSNITFTARGNDLISSINLQPNTIKIQSKNIDITGAVTFSALDTSMQGKVNTYDGWKQTGKTTINGGVIETGSISASSIKTNELIVGTNVQMGANAYISWGNVSGAPTIPNGSYLDSSGRYTGNISWGSVTGTPTIPKGTYIDANGVYTGTVVASQIVAGTMSADRINGGTITGVGINITSNARVGKILYLGDAPTYTTNNQAIIFNGYARITQVNDYDLYISANTTYTDNLHVYGNHNIVAKFG